VSELKRLGSSYWTVVAIAVVFTLARFSEAFLILRAQSEGLALALVPAVLVLMNVFYALSSYPAGVLSDNGSRTNVLAIGLVLLIAADLVLALTPGLVGVAVGVVLWGLHLGFSQGLLSALIADTAPPEIRGTAFGMLNLITGVALLAASIIAGKLWDAVGPQATFLAGAGFAAVACIGLLLSRNQLATSRANS
jgi:MFS family permease